MKIYTSPFGDSKTKLVESSVWEFVWTNPNNIPDDKPALIDAISGETWTRSHLRANAQYLAYGLRFPSSPTLSALQAGDTVCIFSPNSIHYPLLVLACQCAGLVVSTANAAYASTELCHQLRDSNAKLILTHPDILHVAQDACSHLGWNDETIQNRIVLAVRQQDLSSLLSTNFKTYDQYLINNNKDVTLYHHQIQDPKNTVAYLGYSSGTSGPAKGVMSSHYNMTSVLSSLWPIDLDHNSIQAAVLPLSHIYALTKVLHWPILTGQIIVVFPKFNLRTFCKAVQRYRISCCMLVPPIALSLARDPLVEKYDLSSLKLLVCGAAPLGRDLEEELSRKIGVGVGQAFGLTEMTPTTHYCPLAYRNPGSIGFLLPNMQARIVDPVTLKDVPGEGIEGEMWLRGPNRMLGYLNRKEANEQSITKDGWLRTGDVAMVKQNYFFVTDRLKELIKYKGYQVPPAELEALLLTHPKVKDSCVIGVYDESQATELPRAYVVLSDGVIKKNQHRLTDLNRVIERELQEFVKKNASPSRRLRGGVVIVDVIPKSPSGKILRRILREKAKNTKTPVMSKL